jgi:hypothetical protein
MEGRGSGLRRRAATVSGAACAPRAWMVAWSSSRVLVSGDRLNRPVAPFRHARDIVGGPACTDRDRPDSAAESAGRPIAALVKAGPGTSVREGVRTRGVDKVRGPRP